MITRPAARPQAATACGERRARHYGFPGIGPRAKMPPDGAGHEGRDRICGAGGGSGAALIAAVGVFVFQ
jgi:hypothetical protein